MELEIVKYLNNIRSKQIDFFSGFLSNELFLILFWTTITLAFYFFDKHNGKKIFWMVILSLIFHFSISEGLFKNLLAEHIFRLRPYLADADIIAVGRLHADSSFPSSHMSSALSMLSVYFYYHRKYWPAMVVFIFLMAFSRMYNGMHYPSDVLAGSILGIIFGIISIYLICKIYNYRQFRG